MLARRTRGGGRSALDGVRAALRDTAGVAPAETVRALEDAITASSKDRLEDDATIVVARPHQPALTVGRS